MINGYTRQTLEDDVASGQCFHDIKFYDADYNGGNFIGWDFMYSHFVNCDMQNVDFRWANLIGVTFRRVNLDGAKFDGALLSDTKYILSNMRGVSTIGIQWMDAFFIDTDVSKTDLTALQGNVVMLGAINN